MKEGVGVGVGVGMGVGLNGTLENKNKLGVGEQKEGTFLVKKERMVRLVNSLKTHLVSLVLSPQYLGILHGGW